MGRAALPAVLGLLRAASPTLARTGYITPDGTGDAPTIQTGIDAAESGDLVLVAAGPVIDCVGISERPPTRSQRKGVR